MGVILPLSIPEYNFSLGGLDRADHTPWWSVTSPCQLLSVISLRMNKQSFMIVCPPVPMTIPHLSCAMIHPCLIHRILRVIIVRAHASGDRWVAEA